MKKPLVVIQQILDKDSLSDIKKVIDEPEDSTLLQYFNSNAFFCLQATTKEEALTEMADNMVALDFFNQQTVTQIYGRERISSTDIGNLIADKSFESFRKLFC